MQMHQFEPMTSLARALAVAGALLATAGAASADSPLYASYENMNYAGTVTRYATLADAQNQTNALRTDTIATATNETRSTLPNARDGQIYAARSAPGYDSDIAYFSTAWYFTNISGKGDGWGNPNNTNNGFIQFYNPGSIATSVSGGWSNGAKTFTVNLSGGDGDGSNAARLWAPEAVGGPSGDTGGVFRSFNLNLVANFANAATVSGVTGWLETNADPTSLAGSVTGIFENQSSTNTSVNGFYSFNLTLANGSWWKSVGATYGNDVIPGPAIFAAPVPEPEAYALAFAGMAVVGFFGVRRRRS